MYFNLHLEFIIIPMLNMSNSQHFVFLSLKPGKPTFKFVFNITNILWLLVSFNIIYLAFNK